MTNYHKIAQQYVSEKIGEDFVVITEHAVDLPDLFCFSYQHRKFQETGDFQYMTIGQGPTCVNKKDQRIFRFNAGYTFEKAIQELQQQLNKEKEIRKAKPQFDLQKHFDVHISKIDTERCKEIVQDNLLECGVYYVIPEIVGSCIYRIDTAYRKQLLNDKLSELPRTFHNVDQRNLPDLILNLIKQPYCSFNLEKHYNKDFAKYTNKATPADLDPIW